MSAEIQGSPIARGATAEIYAWHTGTVLKLFRDWFPLEGIEYEARLARAVHAAGLPVPAVGEILEIAGRYGLVYERVDGPTMGQHLSANPRLLFQYARLLAELQANMHCIEALPGLPAQHARLRTKIQAAELLSPELKEGALKLLAGLPEGDRLCHGDFHPDNIVMTDKGPVIIDWIDASLGNPLADVARTTLLITKTPTGVHPPAGWLIGLARQLFHTVYLRHYLQLFPASREELARWQIVNAAGRLSERIAEGQVLLGYVRAKLKSG